MFIMDAWSWFTFWLILHILAVIIGLGPTFAFAIIGAYAASHPEAGRALAEIGEMMERRLVLPVAATIPLFGTALIYTGHYNLWKSTWLLIAIALFIIAYFFAAFVQAPNSRRLLHAIDAMPPGPPPPGATGPPPEIAQVAKRLQMGGMFLYLMIVVIAILMIWRPGSCFTGPAGC